MAAEIGSMKVTEQIDALRAIGVSPIQYLVLPRVIASSVVLVIMTIYANIIGDLGGYIVAVNYGVPSASYINSILHYLTPYDFFMGLIKAFIFGLIIALVGCREGLRTEGGAEGVGRATTSSVVLSIILIFASDFVLARIMFPPK
jgi:phospholipid/cholesterol/gamma-HCH transport system permease protein